MARSVLLSLACLACGTTQQASGCPSGVLVVATSPDYTSSAVGVLPLGTLGPPLLSGNALGSDPALATSSGRHFFVARDLDTLFEIDACGRGIQQLSARAVGEGPADPQDVAVAPDGSLWVARFDLPSLLVLPPAGSPTVVDMSSFDTDSDGNPEMSSVRIIGTKAFVALERITQQADGSYVSDQPSQMAVLDAGSLKTLETVQLAGRNPIGLMVESAGKLWLADAGSFGSTETDAGVEAFDTAAMTTKLVVTEQALGGWVSAVAVSASCGVAIVTQAIPDPQHPVPTPTWLVSFALDGSNLKTAVQPTAASNLRGLLWTTDGRLLLGDTRGPPFVVHTFTSDGTCALTAGPDLPMPLLPNGASMPALAFAD